MGIYNPNKSMPKVCIDCYDSKCLLPLYLKDITKERSPLCPLIEIKTPHGRLIDEDALCYEVVKKGGVDFIYAATSCIKDTPTVIEADYND